MREIWYNDKQKLLNVSGRSISENEKVITGNQLVLTSEDIYGNAMPAVSYTQQKLQTT